MKRIFIVCLALLLALACVGCIQAPVDESEWEGKEEFVAAEGMSEQVANNAAKYEEYKGKVGLAFKQNAESDASCFEFESVGENEVRITKYVGEDSIVVIPERIGDAAVVSLGEGAFASAALRAVYVPDNVRSIEKGAFAGASALVTLRVPFIGDGGENGYFGYIFGADSHEYHAIKVPATLEVVIVGSAEAVADNAFAGCKTLCAVVLPNSVKSIGKFAFYECSRLIYTELGGAVTEVGSYAFGYCSNLFSISLEGAGHVGFGAFYSCNSLYSLTLSVIGESAESNRFLGYIFGAESADYNDDFVPKSLREVKLVDCDEIPDRAFTGCTYIAKFELGEGIESIGVRAFYGCRSMKSVSLPDSVTVIGDDAFFGCDNLEAVDFGAGVTEIGMQAFYGCRSLKSVTIPDKVTEIKSSTFALCESIASVELNNVAVVGKDAFKGCVSLTPIDCSGIEVADGNDCLFKLPVETGK
jgi:hypothetical protein